MKVLGINHIGIATIDINKANWFFKDILSLPFEGDEIVKAQQTKVSIFQTNHTKEYTPSRVEFLQNLEGTEGPIKKYLEKRGTGIHHIALTVENINEALDYLKQKDVRLIDETPRGGAHNTQIAFVHPKSTGGILVELVEEKGAH